jgi:rod shape-determining protein MreC
VQEGSFLNVISMQKTHKKTLLFFALLFLILTSLHYWGKLTWLENTGAKLVNPLIHFFYKQNVKLKNSTVFFQEKKNLLAKVEELESVVNQLKHLEVTSAQLLQENGELKSQLNFFRQHEQYRWVTCNIIGKGIEERADGMIIDCGSENGLKEGQAAVAGEGVLVGKIVQVKDTTSIVRLLNDSKSRVAASVLNGDRSIGVVQGGFGLSVQLTHVPQSEELSVEDLIITSGLEEFVPRGLVVGTVETVIKESHQPFQRGVVRPPVESQKLLILSVIVNE